jgi:hypothetical protein
MNAILSLVEQDTDCNRPSTYALTLSREDVMVWIMNHDVSVEIGEIMLVTDVYRSLAPKRKVGVTPSKRTKC